MRYLLPPGATWVQGGAGLGWDWVWSGGRGGVKLGLLACLCRWVRWPQGRFPQIGGCAGGLSDWEGV